MASLAKDLGLNGAAATIPGGLFTAAVCGYTGEHLSVCTHTDGTGKLKLGHTASDTLVFAKSLVVQVEPTGGPAVQSSWPTTTPTAGQVLKVGTAVVDGGATTWPLEWQADSVGTVAVRTWADLVASGSDPAVAGTDITEISGSGGVTLPAIHASTVQVLTLFNTTNATVTVNTDGGSDTINNASTFPLGPRNTGVFISRPSTTKWIVT